MEKNVLFYSTIKLHEIEKYAFTVRLKALLSHTFKNLVFFCSYQKRFQLDVDPIIDKLVDKAKVEESEHKAKESQKQVKILTGLVFLVSCLKKIKRLKRTHATSKGA